MLADMEPFTDVETRTPPALSTEVKAAVLRAVSLSHRLNAVHPSECTPGFRADISVRYLSLALDHREAIILLVRHDARSAAFSLTRSVYEACTRGIWTLLVAADADIERFAQDGIVPTFDRVVRELSRAHSKSYSSVKAKAWEHLSDFAHGGRRQLARWSSESGIEPVHPDSEVIDLLAQLDYWAIMCCAGIHEASGAMAPELVKIFDEMQASRQDPP